MHIHRWYLHVEPFRWDRVRARLASHPQRSAFIDAIGDRSIEDVGRAVGGVTVLEHLLCQPVTPDSLALLTADEPAEPALAIGSHRVYVVDAASCLPAGVPAVVPASLLRTGADSYPVGFAATVLALLEATGLGYLVRLAGGIVLHRPDATVGPRDVVSDDELLTTLVVPAQTDP